MSYRYKKDVLSIRDVFDAMRKKYALNKGLTNNALQDKWESIVGSLAAKHTTKVYITGTKIYVFVDNSTLRNELHYTKSQIVDRVNEVMGFKAITDAVIK